MLPLAALAACAMADDETVETSVAADAALGEAIAGRSAGSPVSCVRQQDLRNSRAVGDRAILFDGPGGTVYLNRTRSPCPRIQPWHALRHQSTRTGLCSGDLIQVFDSQTGVEYGGCSLGEFTPYRRGS